MRIILVYILLFPFYNICLTAVPQFEPDEKPSDDGIFDPGKKYEMLCDSSFVNSFEPEIASGFIKEARKLANKYNFRKKWKLQIAEAWMYFNEEKYDSIKFYITQISEHYNASDTSQDQLLILYHLGYLNNVLLRYSEATYWYQELLDQSMDRNDLDHIVKAYWGLESAARNTKDFDLAKTYLEKLLVHLETENSTRKGLTLQSYAENAIKREDYPSALKSLKSAIITFRSCNNVKQIPNVYNQIGWVYNALGNQDSSIFYYEKSLKDSRVNDREKLSADTYGNLGLIYFNSGDYKKAIQYFDSILYLALKINNRQFIRFGYYHLSNAYDSIGDFRNAHLNFKKLTHLIDSTRKEEIEKIYIHERTKFETKTKEKELEIVSMKYRTNRIILFSSLGVTVLILLIVLLLFRNTKLKSNQKIAEFEKQMSEVKQVYLRKQMNPHFVFNTLNSIQYFMFQNDKIATNSYMSKFAMLIRKTLDNSRHSFVPIKYEIDALQLYVELEQLRFKNRFSYKINIHDEIDVLQHKIPSMLIQPFVENSINHGLHSLKANGRLLVDLKLIDNKIIECNIEDNGIGRKKAEEIKRLKQKDHHSIGTVITRERLNIIDSVTGNNLKIKYTDLKDEKNNSAGTRVIIQIPVVN